jgi:hypothetical protein
VKQELKSLRKNKSDAGGRHLNHAFWWDMQNHGMRGKQGDPGRVWKEKQGDTASPLQ